MTTRLNRRKDGFTSAPRAIHFDAEFRARLRDLLLWRRDVRRFRPDPLPAGILESLIELACFAPSVGLSQPWRFVIVEDAARRAAVRENFAACNAQALSAQAPQRAGLYARLKLAGLGEAPVHFRRASAETCSRPTAGGGITLRHRLAGLRGMDTSALSPLAVLPVDRRAGRRLA